MRWVISESVRAAAAVAAAHHMMAVKVWGTSHWVVATRAAQAIHSGAEGQRAPAATAALTTTKTSA